MKFPKHIALTISHNEHRCYYESLEDYFTRPQFEGEDKEMIKKCIEAGELWEGLWYPDTPIGQHYVFAPSFDEICEAMAE